MKLYRHVFQSPVGDLFTAVDEDGALVRLSFAEEENTREFERELEERGHRVLPGRRSCQEVERQIGEYFHGRRTTFDLDLRPEGTPFQQTVWRAVRRIGYGRTKSYAAIAKAVRRPKAFRAVGRCNATNPVVIVVPCHRVIGSDGRLTGYGGGLMAKETLLEMEQSIREEELARSRKRKRPAPGRRA